MTDLTTLAWPAAKLGEALEALARTVGLAPRALESLSPPAGPLRHGDEALGRWLVAAAAQLGLEAEPTQIAYGEVERRLHRVAPALLCLRGDGEPGVLALLGGGRRTVSFLGPNLLVHRRRRAVVCA